MPSESQINRQMLVDVPDELGAAMADRIISGVPVSDVLEMFVDEITTTTNVGSGTATALGSPAAHKVQKAQRKKAMSRYKDYLKKMKMKGKYESDKKAFASFMDSTGISRSSRGIRERFRRMARAEGFKV